MSTKDITGCNDKFVLFFTEIPRNAKFFNMKTESTCPLGIFHTKQVCLIALYLKKKKIKYSVEVFI